jgi:uncharacterized protein (TIGR03089 family)
MAATDTLLAGALRRDPAGPLLTYYDDSTGERVELSATTLLNWVAKTANLLVDDIGLAPGERVAVLLPAHWQTAAVLLAAWATGAVVSTEPAGAAAAFVTAGGVPAAVAAGVPEVLALPLAPLGRGFDGPPPEGARDFPAEVRGQADRYAGPPVPGTAPALYLGAEPTAGAPDGNGATAGTVDGAAAGATSAGAAAVTTTLDSPDGPDTGAADPAAGGAGDAIATGTDLVEVALRRAADLGLREGDRLLTVLPWEQPADWVDGLLAPLAAGATLVLCASADPGLLRARTEAEQVTATLGVTVSGVRAL